MSVSQVRAIAMAALPHGCVGLPADIGEHGCMPSRALATGRFLTSMTLACSSMYNFLAEPNLAENLSP